MIGDKTNCRIISYEPSTKTFIVEPVYSKRRGMLPITAEQTDQIDKLKALIGTEDTVALYFIGTYHGQWTYSTIYKPKPNSAAKEGVAVKQFVSLPFSDDQEFNKRLFENLLLALGEVIDSQDKYELAKQLIVANRSLRIVPNIFKDVYFKCNKKFAVQLWKDGIVTYCDNFSISQMWKNGDEEERQTILTRLGISLPEQETSSSSINPVFANIANEIITRINLAQERIDIAMAWFTNFDIFNSIKSALGRGVEVNLVTNNDLINNGGYCLDFNSLIGEGLKMRLVEYPEMLHYKFCIIDNSVVITGSYNWTFFAEEINQEDIVIIEDDNDVIEKYNAVFSDLMDKYPQIDRMPDTVPDRPQYDRSSFKQYISEELVLRTKRRIGDSRTNILNAKKLAPDNPKVLQALTEYHIIENNSERSTAEIDYTVSQEAIEERRQRVDSLNAQQTTLNTRATTLEERRTTLIQQQQVQQQETETRLSAAQTDEEREEIVKASETAQAEVASEIQRVEEQQEQITSQISDVSSEIEQAQEEIQIIQQTSKIESIGGRGALKINLKWGTIDDLDLHVYDPDDFGIYYGQKTHECQGVIGRLDVDANAQEPYTNAPQENIYWEGKAPLGHYRVEVVLFCKRSEAKRIPCTITIIPEIGKAKKFTKIFSPNDGCKSITEFNYSENGIEYISNAK